MKIKAFISLLVIIIGAISALLLLNRDTVSQIPTNTEICPTCFTPRVNYITVEERKYVNTNEVIEDKGEIYTGVTAKKIEVDLITVFRDYKDQGRIVYTLKSMDLKNSKFEYYKWILK